jgi:electron transfer flavoprotein beta subunit
MNIIVCVKQIPDPEIPATKFKLDAEGKNIVTPEGIPPVINPYDEQAVEVALKIKEKHGGKIAVLTIGNDSVTAVVKHALAMGADEGFLLQDQAFEASDSFSTAYILSRAIHKIKGYDLVLCGRQAADWEEGLVGSILAENLGHPLVTLAESIDFIQGRLRVKRVILGGYQVFDVSPPAIITVSHEAGPPRLPSGWGIISASKKEIQVWNAENIAADLSRIGREACRKKLVRLYIPEKKRKCEILEGDTLEEAVVGLIEKLRERGAL